MEAIEDQQIHVAYLGPPSSYTHQAALDSFGGPEYILQPQVSIEDVFIAVQSTHTSFGVVPVENSSNGFVSQTLDSLVDREDEFSDVTTCGATYIAVQHCLIGFPAESSNPHGNRALSPSSSGQRTPTLGIPNPSKPRSQPLTDLQHITDVYSHPQGLGQCDDFLSTYLRAAERHETTSTSKAAEDVAENPSRTAAAISSRLAAQMYGLTLLAENIQNIEKNLTRFLILRRKDSHEPPILPASADDGGQWKVLVAFSIDQSAYGALAEALLVYKKHALNLTSINSRPSRIRLWHYIFLVEFSCGGDPASVNGRIEAALDDLGKVTEVYKYLGFWRE